VKCEVFENMENYLRFLDQADKESVESYYTSIGIVYDEVNGRRLAALGTQIDMDDRVRESGRFIARFRWANFRRGVSHWFWEVA